jgi:ketosteroid isomerase-like protein
MTTTTEAGDLARANAEVVRRHLDAINDWDFEAMRANLHPDITYVLPFAPDAFPRVTEGIDAVMAFCESIPAFAAEENLHDVTIRALADDPGELVAE